MTTTPPPVPGTITIVLTPTDPYRLALDATSEIMQDEVRRMLAAMVRPEGWTTEIVRVPVPPSKGSRPRTDDAAMHGTVREVAAHTLKVGDVLALPMGRTATVSAPVKAGKRFVTVTTEHGESRYEPQQPVMVERR